MASSPPKMGGPVRGRGGEARRRDRGQEGGGCFLFPFFRACCETGERRTWLRLSLSCLVGTEVAETTEGGRKAGFCVKGRFPWPEVGVVRAEPRREM